MLDRSRRPGRGVLISPSVGNSPLESAREPRAVVVAADQHHGALSVSTPKGVSREVNLVVVLVLGFFHCVFRLSICFLRSRLGIAVYGVLLRNCAFSR